MIEPLLIGMGIVFVIFVLWVLVTYNRLVNLRNLIHNSWSNVDTELKRRYDLIPNLVNTVKGYATHEQEVLEQVTQARTRCVASNGSIDSQAKDENILVRALQRLFVVIEGYPELKANQNFLALQQELVNTEDRIQAARRYFNGNVKDFNNMVQMIPSNIIANIGGFRAQSYFEIEDSRQRQAVDVKFMS